MLKKEEMVMNTKEAENKRMFVGIVWNCAAELKLFITAFVFLCSLALVLQFLPPRFSVSPTDVRNCLTIPVTTPVKQIAVIDATTVNQTAPIPIDATNNNNNKSSSSSSSTGNDDELLLDNGVLKRSFKPYGTGAYNFVLMSAYRGGSNTFAVIGLSSKPLHIYGKPTYRCRWIPNQHKDFTMENTNLTTSTTSGYKILPDWGYGRIYTVVVVNCTFSIPIDNVNGGRLVLEATTNDSALNVTDSIVALDETSKDYDHFVEKFVSPSPKYDYLYCGSSLYGDLSPQRVREWMAYHVRLLGNRSHFVIHDAGGVHEGVLEVLKPWMEKGFVTLQDIRDQEIFDGYYHNQFLVVNDCLHRYRFDAKWMFFFDVDEFIYVPSGNTVSSVLDSLSDFTQFTIEQITMSNKLCLPEDAPPTAFRKWGFEKLVYKDVKRGIRRDRKYAVQPRNVFATGVHMSQNTKGKTLHKTDGRMKYFHYHGTIAQRREPCKQLVNSTGITLDGVPYIMDTTMRKIAGSVKIFELKMIGSVLQRTRQ